MSKFCIHCGTENGDNDKFCMKCGKPLTEDNKQQSDIMDKVSSMGSAAAEKAEEAGAAAKTIWNRHGRLIIIIAVIAAAAIAGTVFFLTRPAKVDIAKEISITPSYSFDADEESWYLNTDNTKAKYTGSSLKSSEVSDLGLTALKDDVCWTIKEPDSLKNGDKIKFTYNTAIAGDDYRFTSDSVTVTVKDLNDSYNRGSDIEEGILAQAATTADDKMGGYISDNKFVYLGDSKAIACGFFKSTGANKKDTDDVCFLYEVTGDKNETSEKEITKYVVVYVSNVTRKYSTTNHSCDAYLLPHQGGKAGIFDSSTQAMGYFEKNTDSHKFSNVNNDATGIM